MLRSEPNPLIKQIQLIFYNDLASLALDTSDINQENIVEKIRQQINITIFNILINQAKYRRDSIYLPTGIMINEDNCPTIYFAFFKALLMISNEIFGLSFLEINSLKENLKNNQIQSPVEVKINKLADTVLEMNTFKEIIPGVINFILDAKGITHSKPSKVEFNQNGVTLDLVRNTFYNEMVNQTLEAVNNKWITIDDLESQESYIFFALPALTLIEAINQSKNCEGIRLLDDKMLTLNNCPKEEDFAELFTPILKKKEAVYARCPEELLVLKQLCLSKDSEIPQELMKYKTSYVTDCAAVINEIASQISRRGVFKLMINKVIEVCLENSAIPKVRV